LPALLLCYEQALRTRSWCWALLCPLVFGLQFVGGHFQVSAYVVLAFLLYALVRVVTPGLGSRARLRGVVLVVISLGWGLLLAAAQILPTLELAAQTGRVSHGVAGALRTAFPLGQLVLYLVPNFFGNPVHSNYWGSYRDPGTLNFLETACYVGILPLLLSVWSLRRWREPGFWFFSLLTVFAVLVAVGSPIYVVLYHLAPGFRELAGLGRILCLAAFGFAGLAALGLDDLLSLTQRSRVRSVLVFSALAAVSVLASYAALRPVMMAFSPQFPGYFIGQLLAFAALLVTGAVLIVGRARLRLSPSAFSCLALAVLIADLFGFGIRFNPYTDARMAYPETETTRWLQRHAGHDRVTSLASDGMDWMAHNSAMIFGLRDIHGSDSLRVRRSFELVSPPNGNQSRYPPSESRLLDVLGVRYLITDQQVTGRWRLVHDSETPVYENPYAAPRAYCAHRLQAADEAKTREMMSRGGRPALVSPDVERELRGKVEPAVLAIEEPCQFLRDDPDQQVIETHAASGALLVVADSYYPGWRVWVDGRAARIYRVNYGFRGIPVPAGEHRVEMRYEPASYRCGLFLSLLALSVMAGLASASRLASRASASTTAGRR
jgi:hypothetical protein